MKNSLLNNTSHRILMYKWNNYILKQSIYEQKKNIQDNVISNISHFVYIESVE